MTKIDEMQNLVENIDVKENKELETVKPAGETNLTELEKQVLDEMANESGWGEFILEEREQYLSVLPISIPMKQLRGVLSSLIKKGYIAMWEDEDVPGETIVTITDKFIEYHEAKEKKQTETFCRFELGDTDEDNWDTDTEFIENDIDIYNKGIEKLEEKFGDRLEHLNDYRYTVSDLTDDEIDGLIAIFEKIESDLDYCYINYDFEEKEE